MFGFLENTVKGQIKAAKQTLKQEIENIYNEIDENDEKIAEEIKTKIQNIPKKQNYFSAPQSFHDEIQGVFNVIANIAYFTVDRTDDVAGLLKDIFNSIIGS